MAKIALALLLSMGAAHSVMALDYRSVSEAAVLFDAPSQKAKPLYVIAPGTPVEVVVNLDAWAKVRDMKGDLSWIERRQLDSRRVLQVRTGGAQVRSEAFDTAPLVFETEADVLLEYLEPGPAGWVKVRHRDGEVGFVKVGQVWGL
ncbi:SH3 domain-containing protein [Sulfuricystis multivorans]|uniref:SH3 domain-containing protein n=1 Tax=Sulfuricystis multivorans TaxID=2211108 RepID=UPI000F8377EB|nr:SH3 domain-containing protein [Sulfuricystis multivorans]